MSIATKLTELASDISDAYDSISTKGGAVPANKNTNNLASAIENIPDTTGSDFYTFLNNRTHYEYMFYMANKDLIKKIFDSSEITPSLFSQGTNFSYMFAIHNGYSPLYYAPEMTTSNGTNFSYMFDDCSGITTVPLYDLSKATNTSYMFRECTSLTTVPSFNVEKVTNARNMFEHCAHLTNIPDLNFKVCSNMDHLFVRCTDLVTAPAVNCEAVTTSSYMFNACTSLTTIPELNFKMNRSVANICFNCTALTTLGGFKDLGYNYLTSAAANYSNYKLTLSSSTRLTEQSLINILNGLYNIGSNTVDGVAGKGCRAQSIILGSTNIAKLTSAEGQAALTKASQKGWTIS